MIAKKNRFTKEQLAALLSQKGLVVAYNTLGTLKYLPEGQALVVVTSGKHEKRAVVRNKVRRRLYSLFRTKGARFSGVFYISKQAYSIDYKTTRKLFEELLFKTTK